MGSRSDHQRCVQVFTPDTRGRSRVEPSCRASRVLQRGGCRDRLRTPPRRNARARHRRQSRCVERGRHADSTAAGPASPTASRAARCAGHRPRQRRDRRRGPRIGRSSTPRPCRDLTGGGRSVGVFRTRKTRCLETTRRTAAHRRRPLAPAPVRPPIRCHCLGAVQPLDGRRCGALYPRVLRRRACAIAIGRRVLPVGSHLRDLSGGSAVNRPHVRLCLP